MCANAKVNVIIFHENYTYLLASYSYSMDFHSASNNINKNREGKNVVRFIVLFHIEKHFS